MVTTFPKVKQVSKEKVTHVSCLLQDVYETFNIMMRRKPKENNFKAVLETIRDLMNTDCVVPDWLHDLILGYGSPDSAHYSQYVDTDIVVLPIRFLLS